MNLKKVIPAFILMALANIALSQVNTFPYSESFEQSFTTGTDVAFISNWTGNDVRTTSRIFQGSDARTGSASINVIPTSSFNGEIQFALDLTGVNNPKIQFYAYSKQNGSVTSTRPATVSFSTSVDGGNNFLDDTAIGDETTFPNDNTTSYTLYEYELPVAASDEANVVVLITIGRGDGSGSVAEFIMDDLTVEEQVLPLGISSVSASTNSSVVVTFNQEVTQASAETIANYQINNGISISAASRTAVNEVTLSTSVMSNNNYTLTVNHVADAASNTPAVNLQDSYTFAETLSIASTTVTNKNTLEVLFNLELDETSAETLINYTIDNSVGNPTAAVLDAANAKKVTLTLGADLTDNSFSLTVDNVQDASTLSTASGLTDMFSYLPLEVSTIAANSDTEIRITFNQNLASIPASDAGNYNLNFGFGSPDSAVPDANDASIVTLTFSDQLVNNTYSLSFSNITNTSGNANADGTSADLTYTTATLSRQIVINEIFADPTGSDQPDPQVLPGGTSDEFIELFNASAKAIHLGDFDLTGGTVGDYVLASGSYVILTSTSSVSDYQGFGAVVGVTSWNGLSNGGERIILKDNLGNIVDSLTFDVSWYQDEAKSDGGWTIEQINPELICSDANNWIASNDAQGGTPGAQNNVFDTTPDTTGPDLLSVTASTDQEIVVTFNEIMDESSLTSGTYTLSDGISVTTATANSPGLRSVTLTLNTAMVSGAIYDLTATGVTDCAGNAVNVNALSFLFDDQPPVFQRFVFKDATTIDLIFDEDLSETIAETESNFSLDQGIGNPASAILNSENSARVRLEFDQALEEGTGYSLTYENLTDTLGNSISATMNDFTFTNAIDTVIVVSSQLLDVYFNEDVATTSAQAPGNYIVDNDIGSPKTALQDDDNPKLVHLIFETAFNANRERLISFENIKGNGGDFLQLLNTAFTYDTDRPGIDEVEVVDQNTLIVYFDEQVDITSAEAINNYNVNNDIGTPVSATLLTDKKSVQLIFSTDFENEVENTVSIKGIQDLAMNEITTTRNIDFTYDVLAPRLTSLKVVSPTRIQLTFSETLSAAEAELTTNYLIDNGLGNPLMAALSAKDINQVILEFSSLGNNAVNTLTIAGLADKQGNILSTDITSTFATNEITIGAITVLTDSTLQIQFSKTLMPASAENVSTYTSDNGLTMKSAQQDVMDASLVILTYNEKMSEIISYQLHIADITDTDGNMATDLEDSFVYDPQLGSIMVINENTIRLNFNNPLDASMAELTTNYMVDNGLGNPLSAVLNDDDQLSVTLIFAADLLEGIDYQLDISGLTDSFGDLIPASSQDLTYDITAPAILSISSAFTNEIIVSFDETVDEGTAQTLNHYSLDNGAGNPNSAVLATNETEVVLTFSSDLTDMTDYTLTIDRIEDQNGNAIDNQAGSFTFTAPINPEFRELIINEIYPDPDVSSPLPNVEFVEIFNQSSSTINLRDFEFTDNSSSTTLQDYELAAGTYLILTSSTNAQMFESFGEVMGVSGFPSLSNSGETLFLKRRDSQIVDSLQYDLTFYNDAAKEDGGYTIELINPEAHCFDSSNYAASTNGSQGSPGAQNSVFDNTPDTTAPELVELTVISDQQLSVNFSESMDIGSIAAADFTISDGVTVADIELQDEFGTEVLINLTAAFERGVEFTLTIADLNDCAGNAIIEDEETFFLGATPVANEIIITEIMADPSPSQGLPEVEYIEVYNISSKILSLDGLTLSDLTATTNLPDVTIGTGEYLVLTANSNTNEFTSINVTGVSGFPSLNTSGDSLAIADAFDNMIFDVVYSQDFYRDEAKANGGFSLEMINPEAACFDDANWTATNNTSGGTPGLQNSVFDNTPDTTAPELVELTVISDQQLSVTFNESMDVGSIAAADFTISGGVTVADIEAQDEFGTQVLINLTTAFERGVGLTLTVADLNDCAGNAIIEVEETFFLGATPVANEIIITEIMADPSPSQGLPEVEYIEVYNASSKILSLNGLTLSDLTATTNLPDVTIGTGEYLVLTSTSNTDEFTGISVAGVSGFTSLNTSGDSLTIADAFDNLIFDVVYNQDFYRDETKANGGFSLEMINPEAACFDDANWTATNNTSGGTPGLQNSVFDNTPDTTAPELVELTVISDQQLSVTFNESMDVGSITATDFTVSGGVAVSDIEAQDEFGTEVLINLTPAFERGVELTLTVADLSDCAGNVITETEETFFLGATPTANEIIITEIMADPSPAQGLPEVEYIEVYNASSKILSLDGLTLSDLTATTNLPDVTVRAGEYLVLTATSNTDEFTGINVAGVSGFPSLNTSGDSLAIADASDNLIFDVVYNQDFYRDQAKEDGGFSLEMINPEAACFDDANWTATNNTSGGTPGLQNSVFDNTPDTTAPELVELTVISDQQLSVTFNESMDVGSITATDFTVSGGVAVSDIEAQDEFGTEVLINLTAAFQRGAEFTLTIADLSDCAGNTIAEVGEAFFLGDVPTANEIIITEIMADPSPAQGLPEVEYIEVYNASSKILSLDGLTLSDLTATTNLPDVTVRAGEYLVLTATSNTDEFTGINVAGVSGFTSLNTSGDSLAIADASDNLIFDVVYNQDFYRDQAKEDGGFSLEMINPEAACFDDANWTATNNTSGGTPGLQNSVFDNTPDTTAPELVELTVISDQQLSVTFNESMDVGSITATDFTVSGGVAVSDIEAQDEFGTEVLINLNTAFERGAEFTLTIADLSDCAGNTIAEVGEAFFLGDVPTANEIIITEIMADPAPSQGLPEVEYIEILNVSGRILSLQGISLSDRTSSTLLPATNIAPGAYAILTSNSGATQFTNAIGVSGFPSLNTSGDDIMIGGGPGEIFSVSYTDDWYRDSNKASGGYSLEMIDTAFPCQEANNWIATTSNTGGTPGSTNSVEDSNPDLIGPRLVQAVALTDQTVLLTYDERLEINGLTVNSFSISNGINVTDFTVGSSKKEITLTTGASLVPNTPYTVNSDNITDCSGNLITSGFESRSLVIAVTAEVGDILINEILFNPLSGGVRFVELYNNSTNFINLKNWLLAGASTDRDITADEVIMAPGDYLTLTTDINVLSVQYPRAQLENTLEMNSFPSFPNSEGTVAIISENDVLIDLFDYSEDFHSALLDDVDGVSLERIRFTAMTNDPNNWQSASSTEGFATPGYLNSQSQQSPDQNMTVNIEPKAFAPDVAGMANFTTINFVFDNPGNTLNVKIYDAGGNFVQDIAQNALVGTEGFFRWDGTYQNGSKARVGSYMIVFEIISPDGAVSLRKELVAIGTRF